MEYSTAREIYQKLNAATKGDEDAEILYRDLVKLAVDYARRRTNWQLMDIEARIQMDEARTIGHDAFIGSCNSLSRYLERVVGQGDSILVQLPSGQTILIDVGTAAQEVLS